MIFKVIKAVLATSLLALAGMQTAQAGETPLEEAYLDLVFGHCFQEVLGQSLRFNPNPARSSNWNRMPTQPQGKDLRVLDTANGDLVVDLADKQVCWSQAGTADPSTMAARLRLELMDGKYKAELLNEVIEQTPDGQVSKFSVVGVTGWPNPNNIPVVTIREMIQPQQKLIISQVMIAQKN